MCSVLLRTYPTVKTHIIFDGLNFHANECARFAFGHRFDDFGMGHVLVCRICHSERANAVSSVWNKLRRLSIKWPCCDVVVVSRQSVRLPIDGKSMCESREQFHTKQCTVVCVRPKYVAWDILRRRKCSRITFS